VLSDDESLLLFRGLHTLGAARDGECCQPLLRLLRRPFQEIKVLLGNTVTESMTSIVTGVFDGDVDTLFDLMIDRSIDRFIRAALFGAATFLTWERRTERDRMQGFLVRFHEERPAETAIRPGRRHDAGRSKLQCAVIQARASRWAVAISASDIISATSRRRQIASVRPFSAARLNHLWAATRLTTPERPLAQYRPRSNSTSGIAVASTGVAASRSMCP
jgi:hypothetical protein